MNMNKQVAADRAQSNIIKMYGVALEDFYKTGNNLSLDSMHNIYKSLHKFIQTRHLARKLQVIAYKEFGIILTPDSYRLSKCPASRFATVQRHLEWIEVLKAGILEIK